MPEGVITRKGFVRTHRTCSAPMRTDNHLIAIGRTDICKIHSMAIIAVVEFSPRGKLVEWQAYWGCAPTEMTTTDIAQEVGWSGAKMSQCDGEHFFPRLDGTYYR